jgi:hypothetical protein
MSLKINTETAKKLYPESKDWFRKELEKAFGEECFKKPDWKDIKSFKDVYIACGTTEQEFNDKFNKIGLDSDTVAYEKAKLVAKAINQGWVPDWNNTNQRKWWPWFNLSSGFGFSLSYCDYGDAYSAVGSRLCFESEEKSNYAGKQFLKIYKEFLT